jgi:ribosomal protein S18 acetylase RimI-like enzyme
MQDLRSRRVVAELDAYFDAAPRADAEPFDTGAFTLFVGRSPSSYYARPSLSHDGPITPADLDALEMACGEHGVNLAIEWVREIHPELAEIAASHELEVSSHALMIADSSDVVAAEVEGVRLRIIDPEDPALPSSRAVADVSFTFGGTASGFGGPAERDVMARALSAGFVEHLRDRHRRGLTVTAVGEDERGVLAVGSYQPIGELAEIVAVATLPEARRRGLAGAVTALLARHAREHGVPGLLLSAQDDDVARVYQRVGFRRVGTTHAAERI